MNINTAGCVLFVDGSAQPMGDVKLGQPQEVKDGVGIAQIAVTTPALIMIIPGMSIEIRDQATHAVRFGFICNGSAMDLAGEKFMTIRGEIRVRV